MTGRVQQLGMLLIPLPVLAAGLIEVANGRVAAGLIFAALGLAATAAQIITERKGGNNA